MNSKTRKAIDYGIADITSAGLNKLSFNQVLAMYENGYLDYDEYELYMDVWHADGTKLSVTEYQENRARRNLIKRYADKL